jgi:LPXTG-motif cell wall-anchored protein
MKIVLSIIGVLVALMGVVWFLQGINILPGSFMTGQILWAIIGAVAMLIGVGLVFFANRRRPVN